MARSRPPSFDFYPEDFLAGTMHLHPACIGIYIRLLCFQWSHGAIPSDKRQLMQITGAMADELDLYLSQVLNKFELCDDGLYRNARLERERDKKQKLSEARAEAGRRGGRPTTKSDSSTDSEGIAPANSQGNEQDEKQLVSVCLSKSEAKQKPPIGKLEVGSKEVPGKERRSDVETRGEWQIPPELDTPEVRELLVEFEVMRARIKRPIRDRRNSSRVLKHFDDVAHLTYALDVCIANEWQGLDSKYRKPEPVVSKPRVTQRTFAQMQVDNTIQAGEEWLANG